MSPAFSTCLDLPRLAAASMVFIRHAAYGRYHGAWRQVAACFTGRDAGRLVL